MRVLKMVRTDKSVILHAPDADPRVVTFIESNKLESRITPAYGNSWRSFFSGLINAIRNIRGFQNSLFIVWSHHLDSNRWLQLVLALSRSNYIVVERLVPSDRSAFEKSRLTVPIKRFVISRARAVIMVGHSQIAHYRSLLQSGSGRVIAIPNTRSVAEIGDRIHAFTINSPSFRADKGLPTDAKIIVCVGRLCEQKGQITLIKAVASIVARYPDLYVVLLGDGPDSAELQALSGEILAGHVLFPGHGDPIPWLSLATVFVLPSVTEGLPGCLLEAMAARLPCIATDIPGNHELVLHGITGLCVPIQDTKALADAICILLEDPNLMHRYADAGHSHVLANYDEPIEVSLWRELFESLLAPLHEVNAINR